MVLFTTPSLEFASSEQKQNKTTGKDLDQLHSLTISHFTIDLELHSYAV